MDRSAVDRTRTLVHRAASHRSGRIRWRSARRLGWTTYPEVTFSVYGERGSIDLLALNRADRAAVMLEAKTEIASAEETQRRMDVKTRLLPGITFEREGWRPRNVARILVIGESRTNRRRAARLEALFADSLPARNVAVRRWLRAPVGPLAGIWFLSVLPVQNVGHGTGRNSRVRVPRGPAQERPTPAAEHDSG
jgi:hypothetical protein